MLKRLLLLGLICCMLPFSVCAEGRVVNLVENPEAEWAFEEGASILEVCFPTVTGADACIIRMGDEVMLVDAATEGQFPKVAEALEQMGITRVQVGFNTHPHDDHITGFQILPTAAALDKLMIAFPEDANNHMINTLTRMKESGVPVEHTADGDVLRIGEATLEVIQKTKSWFSENNRSAVLMVQHGECRLLMPADIELDAQGYLLNLCPIH